MRRGELTTWIGITTRGEVISYTVSWHLFVFRQSAINQSFILRVRFAQGPFFGPEQSGYLARMENHIQAGTV